MFHRAKIVKSACGIEAVHMCFNETGTLNKPKSRQVYTNDGIITQNIFNAAVSTSVKLKTNTKKLYFCEYLIST